MGIADEKAMLVLQSSTCSARNAPKRAYKQYKINARPLPGVIDHYAKAKLLHHVYCAFSEGKLRKLYTKNTE